jgi:site-specific DNA recombinase
LWGLRLRRRRKNRPAIGFARDIKDINDPNAIRSTLPRYRARPLGAKRPDLHLKRLYDAIETGVADLGDSGLKERMAGLKAIRDQAQADTMRAQAMLDSATQQPITATVLRKFAATARKRMRIEGGGYRRDHLRALAHRVEVADREVRIMGSKSDLLRTLAAISGVKSATGGVRSCVLDSWSQGESNP